MKRAALALAVAALAALPSCGTRAAAPDPSGSRGAVATPPPASTAAAPPAAPPAAAGDGSAEDVMFLQMMIPHHRQGVEMAHLAATRAVRGEVRALAAAIEATERDEVQAMTGWLIGWGRTVTAEPHAHDAHGGLHVTSPAEIVALRAMTGAAFERRFLNVLIAHQSNAAEMARTEVRSGRNPEVKALAARIDRSRTAQVRQMLTTLNEPVPP